MKHHVIMVMEPSGVPHQEKTKLIGIDIQKVVIFIMCS